MRKYKVLVLTDHRNHSDQNSIYAFLQEMIGHPCCDSIDVASRYLTENDAFFTQLDFEDLFVARVSEEFAYTASGSFYKENLTKVDIRSFDLIFMRLPRPVSDEFLLALSQYCQNAIFINDPRGIIECGNKSFLLEIEDHCPPLKLCKTKEEVMDWSSKFDIVLKPLREYGGKGLLKISGDILNDGIRNHLTSQYLDNISSLLESEGYLAMKFLKNVVEGDKRLLVVDGEIVGASLRLPPMDSWLCNIAMGGRSVFTEPSSKERVMVEKIFPILKSKGIFMCGIDTLMDDDGTRVVSEINVLSIGGFPQSGKQSGQPVVLNTINKMFKYVNQYGNK